MTFRRQDMGRGVYRRPRTGASRSFSRILGADVSPPDVDTLKMVERDPLLIVHSGGELVEPGAARLRYQFEGKVWVYHTNGAVYFVSLPTEMSADILDLIGQSLNPWGTVPVDATIGDFTWASSMFPRKERTCYDLPLNAKVRKRLGLEEGQMIAVTIEIPLLM